jgi:hypothetical protein
MIDYEGRHPLSPETVFVYIAPPPSPDVDPKGAGRVVDAMRRELGSRRRERVARVDLVPAADTSTTSASNNKDASADMGLQGIDEVILCLKAAISASLEARITAYGEVVRQHLTALQAARPDVCFSDLFLLKDSLAVMMEASGLVEDSVREYLELEVAFQQVEQTKKQQHLLALQQQSSQAPSVSKNSDAGVASDLQQQQSLSPTFTPLDPNQLAFLNGGLHARPGIDEALGIWTDWRATRLSVQGIAFNFDGTTLESTAGHGTTVPTAHSVTHGDTTSLLALRQAVFASQSRVLLKMHRYSEVLHRGLSFFHSSFSTLAAHELEQNSTSSGGGDLKDSSPKYFKEAWAFAGCVSLAAAVAAASLSLSQQQRTSRQEGKDSNSGYSHCYLDGVLEEGEDSSDWRLGLPITNANFQEMLFNSYNAELHTFTTTAAATTTASATATGSTTQSMYCLLGQLYCTARAQLETLGAVHGLQVPEYKGDVAASAAAIGENASTATAAGVRGTPGAGGYTEDGTGSPRRTLHKVRSLSPSRASVDMGGSVRSSFVSASPGGGGVSGVVGDYNHHGGGVESGDEASSLSIRVQSSPFDAVQENMQTIDLAAGNGGNDGDGGVEGDGDGASAGANQDSLGQSSEQSGSGTAAALNASTSSGIATATEIATAVGGPSSHSQKHPRENLGPMAAAAAMNNSSRNTAASELTSAQISADAAEKGVELLPVASVASLPPVAPQSVSPSSSPLAAGMASHQQHPHHLRTNTGSDSGVSTPRSASASGSAAGAATTGAGAAAAGAIPNTTAAAATTTAAVPTTTPPQDAGVALRKIERILDDLWAPLLDSKSESEKNKSAPLTAKDDDQDTTDNNGVWKPVHWRLRRALESQAAFADLWQALTVAAAFCFDHGGRQRQAVQCRAEIADCLAAKGQLAEAARLYEAQCRIALAEGWTLAAAAHLPKLALCQATLQSAGLPHTAAALLKLATTASHAVDSTAVFSPSDATAAVNLLCKAAGLPTAALPLPPPLLPPRPQLPGPGAAGTLPFIISDSGMVDLSSVLAAQPLKGNYSKFYCRNDAATGRPILCPTTTAAAASPPQPSLATSTASNSTTVTHVQCAVGDVNVITLKVYSRLPTSVALHDVRLLLLGMQEMTALASPRAQSPSHTSAFRPSMQNMSLASAWNSIQHGGSGSGSTPHYQQQVATPSTAITGKGGGAAGGGGGGGMSQQSPFFRADSFADEGPRFTTEWQDTEDLQCSLVSISYSEQEQEEDEKEMKKKTATALLTPFNGAVELRPGVNILRFMAAPVKRGLYRPVRITAALQNLEIYLDVEESSALSPSFSLSNKVDKKETSSLASQDQGHFLSFIEDSAAYPIVLEVEPTLPRISIAPVAAAGGGSLIAGQKQWIGLHVVPGRDVLEHATLAVTWPVPPSEIARKMSGLLSHSASTGILGGTSVAATTGGASGSLSPELSFADGGSSSAVGALLPQHNAALITTPPSSSSSQVAAAASLVHHDGHQEIAFPATPTLTLNSNKSNKSGDVDSNGVTVWWWVEAGSFVSPSEQVKVLAPGQQQQLQQQELHDGNGGGGMDTALTTRASSPHVLLHLPLYLQYLSGCRRTFSKIVPLSLYHPFAVTTSARELPNGSIVTHFNVVSLLSHTVTVTATALALQPGLHMLKDIATELGIFPMTVLPHSIFSLSFIVTVDRTMAAGDRAAAQARLQQAAKVQPTALQLSYSVGIEESCSTVVGTAEEESCTAGLRSARSGVFTGHRTTVHGDITHQQQQQTPAGDANGLHLPSSAALLELEKTATASTAPSSSASPFNSSALQQQQNQQQAKQQYQECSFTHHCALELSPLESDIPGAVVLVQLLGPFTATAGQPISLCWRLERAGAVPLQQQGPTPQSTAISSMSTSTSLSSADAEPLKIQFEIGAQGDAGSWRPLGRRSGAVILEPYDGAIATIEATWVPLVAGTVAAPNLRLADVAYQECFEVGSGRENYLVVMPSPY